VGGSDILSNVASASAVLVADDETILHRLLTRVLQRAGFAAVIATDGETAVARLAEAPERFAAVVLDATLPPRGGEAALRALWERRGDLGVVLISGADPDAALRTLVAEHGGEFLAKPFPPEALLKAVERVASRTPDPVTPDPVEGAPASR